MVSGMGITLDVQVFDVRDLARRVLPAPSSGAAPATGPDRPTPWPGIRRPRVPAARGPGTADGSVGQAEPQRVRDVEVVTHRQPDRLGVLTRRQRLVDRPARQGTEHMVTGHGRCPKRPELGLHQVTELGQAHADDCTEGTITAGSPALHSGSVRVLAFLRRTRAEKTAGMDPTGLSSPLGQLLIAAMLLTTIIVLIIMVRRRR